MTAIYRSAFVALRVTPDPALSASLSAVYDRIRTACKDFSLEEPVNYHLTLVFLGQPPFPKAQEVLSAGLGSISPSDLNGALTLRFRAIRAFGSKKQAARVVWAEPVKNERLGRIMAAFAPWLPADQTEQTPHLTIARLRSEADSDWAASQLVGQPLDGEGTIDSIGLLANVGTRLYKDLIRRSF